MSGAPPPVRVLAAVAAALALLSAAAAALRPWLARVWAGHYGNWRDAFLQERIAGLAPFLLGAALVAGGVAALLAWQARRPAAARERWAHPFAARAVLAATLAVGSALSWREWTRWGRPCWDDYCALAQHWARWLGEPGAPAFATLADATLASHVGTSWVPPALIGLVSAAGLPVWLAFMAVNALAWGAVALLLVRLARRYFACDRDQTRLVLVLVFGHFSTMRSLLFLQTDPLALALLLAVFLLSLELGAGQAGRLRLAALLLAQVVGFFTKLSFLPAWVLPPLAALFEGGSEGRARRALRAAWFGAVLPAAACAALLALSGLHGVLANELAFVSGTRIRGAAFSADHGALRFAIALLGTLHGFALAIAARWRAGALRGPDRLALFVIAVVPVSLVLLGAAFWSRYLLALVPFAVLVAAPRVVRWMGEGWARAPIAAGYAATNALVLWCGLYY